MTQEPLNESSAAPPSRQSEKETRREKAKRANPQHASPKSGDTPDDVNPSGG